jgi:hypothetical protein
MSLDIEDLPVVENLGRLGRRTPDSSVADAYRMHRPAERSDIGSFGLALGLQATRFLQEKVSPSSRQLAELNALAGGPSYTMFLDCGGYDYDATCDEACFGFAPHHMDPFYCATCPEQAADPVNNPAYNWHFVGSRGSIQYQDREPDVCNGRDAWKWNVGACNDCAESAVFRCHDGYKKYPDRNYWDPTICQGLVSCDGTLTTC